MACVAFTNNILQSNNELVNVTGTDFVKNLSIPLGINALHFCQITIMLTVSEYQEKEHEKHDHSVSISSLWNKLCIHDHMMEKYKKPELIHPATTIIWHDGTKAQAFNEE